MVEAYGTTAAFPLSGICDGSGGGGAILCYGSAGITTPTAHDRGLAVTAMNRFPDDAELQARPSPIVLSTPPKERGGGSPSSSHPPFGGGGSRPTSFSFVTAISPRVPPFDVIPFDVI